MGLSRHIQLQTGRRFTYRNSRKQSFHTHPNYSSGSTLLPNGLILNLKIEPVGWYTAWLFSKFLNLPPYLFNIFHEDHEKCTTESHWDLFNSTFLTTAKLSTHNNSITIDEIIGSLLDEKIFALETAERHLNYARYLIFILLGYQTSLFSASPLDPIQKPPSQLCITETPGCCNYTHVTLTQNIEACAREPLSELLMGFGVLLPSKNLCLDDDPGIQQAFHQHVGVDAKTFNAYSLRYIAGIKIKWTDALSCHLEFNTATNEVSLFRFPSFCQFCLVNYGQGKGRGVLHSCATTSRLRCQWATETEINDFLLEVLLSYRLLFGQTKKSRAFFRSVDPLLRYEGQDRISRDPLLPALCSARSWHSSSLGLPQEWGLVEKGVYHLPHDFPILRYRIVILQRCLSATAPRTWLQLWRDNRNSANWLTFWAVIFFGAFGSLMALLQVILQFIQLFI